jgi:hypothetical protein
LAARAGVEGQAGFLVKVFPGLRIRFGRSLAVLE